MRVPTSDLFDFFEKHPSCLLERHEVSLDVFSAIRRNVRDIVMAFVDSADPDAQDIARSLRSVISEWLTVPMAFNRSMLDAVQLIGPDSAVVRGRWGSDVQVAYKNAIEYAQQIENIPNPLRVSAAIRIAEFAGSGSNYKIYCHSQARTHFESMCESKGLSVPSSAFLHSVKQYRDAEPFDVLIKVGPLRSRGWGSAPDALLTAPKFDTLLQFVWAGCADEAGFGYDPVSPHLPGTGNMQSSVVAGDSSPPALGIGWRTTQVKVETSVGELPGAWIDSDEFELFADLSSRGDQARTARATLVQIGSNQGSLYPPFSKTLTYDPAAVVSAVDYRLPGDTLAEGMFIAIPILNDASLLGVQAEEGHYSRIWKAKLEAEFEANSVKLVGLLQSHGIHLQELRSRILHWCKSATTVIHAPQQKEHFKILVQVLGIEFDTASHRGVRRSPWWMYAWDEVRRARGEAINFGVNEQQNEDDELFEIVRAMEPQLRAPTETQSMFELDIPAGYSLGGCIRFYKVLLIEEGFLVPSSELKSIRNLDEINKWRS
jgi:hypothetical protein